MQYNSIEELEQKLAERYDGPILERAGNGGMSFSYIPWTETVRRLNAVFGPFGWHISNQKVGYNDGVYTVDISLTVEATVAGEHVTKTVAGVGSAVSRGSNDDNASKSALSDAISRAAKLLGDQFGFFLYEKGGQATETAAPRKPFSVNVTTPGAAPRGVKAENSGKPASDAQKALLKRLGHEGEVEALTMGEASALINKLKTAEASVW